MNLFKKTMIWICVIGITLVGMPSYFVVAQKNLDLEKARLEIKQEILSGNLSHSVTDVAEIVRQTELDVALKHKKIEEVDQRLKDSTGDEKNNLLAQKTLLLQQIAQSSDDLNIIMASLSKEAQLANEKGRVSSSQASKNDELVYGQKNILMQLSAIKKQKLEQEAAEFKLNELKLKLAQEKQKLDLGRQEKTLLEKEQAIKKTPKNKSELKLVTSEIAAMEKNIELLKEQVSAAEVVIKSARKNFTSLRYQVYLAVSKFFIDSFAYLLAILLLWITEIILRTFYVGRIKNKARRYRLARNLRFGCYILTVFLLLLAMLNRLPYFFSVLAVMGAGIAIALQDVLTNLTGFFFILGKKGYKAGDRIEINNIHGDVADVGLFRTALLELKSTSHGEQLTGRLVTIPNNLLFKMPIHNYTTSSNYVWGEITLMITYETDIEYARAVIKKFLTKATKDIVAEATAQRQVHLDYLYNDEGNLEPQLFFEIADSGVNITLYFLTKVMEKREMESVLNYELAKLFAKDKKLDFAYLTRRSVKIIK